MTPAPKITGIFPTLQTQQNYRSLMSELGVVLTPHWLASADTTGWSGFNFSFDMGFTQITNSKDPGKEYDVGYRYIILESVGTAGSYSIRGGALPISEPKAECRWVVRASTATTVRLDTGGELTDILGQLTVYPGVATPDGMCEYGDEKKKRWGFIKCTVPSHSEGTPSRAFYDVDLYPSQAAYDRILALIERGKFPFSEIRHKMH